MINALAIAAEYGGEGILKIGQYLPKLWPKIKSGCFFLNTVYTGTCSESYACSYCFNYN